MLQNKTYFLVNDTSTYHMYGINGNRWISFLVLQQLKMHTRRACNAKTDYPDVAYPSAGLFAPVWIVLYGYGIAINGVSSDIAMVSLLIIVGLRLNYL
jgi:hypothetical protein